MWSRQPKLKDCDTVMEIEPNHSPISAKADGKSLDPRNIWSLALNLISDENLNAASGIKDTTSGDASHAHDTHDGTVHSDGIIRTNIGHCKILCQSEYLILQSAMQELNSRLEQLQGPEYEVSSQ